MAKEKAAAKRKAKAAKTPPTMVIEVVKKEPEFALNSTFKEGNPSLLNCSMSVKLTTRQYENISFGASLSMELRPGADLFAAEKEIQEFLGAAIRPRIQTIREKYPVT